MVGAKQQFGFTKTYRGTGRRATELLAENFNREATRTQARALLEAGFKIRQPRRPALTPTIMWITQNLTIGRAAYILHIIRGAATEWRTVTPPRSFLGISQEDVAELETVMLRRARNVLAQQNDSD